MYDLLFVGVYIQAETGQWCRSDESLDRSNHGGAFSLGLGITGPELFAAASQAGYVCLKCIMLLFLLILRFLFRRDEIMQGKGLSVPEMSKPWSTEDLTSKVPFFVF